MDNKGIHPAPEGFSTAEISVTPLLHFFLYAHLPPKLQETSKAFFDLARFIVSTLPSNAERTMALRKLLEAKDCAVWANLSPRGVFKPKLIPQAGDIVETGGHDEDRDGPIPFDG